MVTEKHKIVLKEVVKGSSIAKAMRKAGYSPSTAKRTNKLTNTKGWQELLDQHLSEEKLTQVLAEGLNATKLSGTGGMRMTLKAGGEVDEVGHSDLEVPDYAVRHKYLETGLKVRGRLKDNEPGGNTFNFNFLTEEQQKRVAGRLQARDTAGEGESNRLLDSNEPEV